MDNIEIKLDNIEIKFRAWDKKNKKMWYSGFSISSYGEVIDAGWHDGDNIPLQFTGLSDKNGKEIYDGDLVTSNRWMKGKRWHIGSLGFFADTYWLEQYMKQDHEFKIIGNIYENKENKELLK